MRLKSCRLLLTLASTILLAGTSRVMADSTVDMQVFTDATSWQAGKSVQIAISLTTDPGWHIYWKNAGEAGLPTKITVKAPPGFIVGDTQYPLPEKFVMPGDIVAYGYTGKVTFVVEVMPSQDFKGDRNVPIHVDASWLCCQEECVMGNSSHDLVLATPAEAGKNANAMKEAQSHLPKELMGSLKLSGLKNANERGMRFGFSHDLMQTAITKYEIFPGVAQGWLINTDIETKQDKTEVTNWFNIHLRPTSSTPDDPKRIVRIPVLVVTDYADGHREGLNFNLPYGMSSDVSANAK